MKKILVPACFSTAQLPKPAQSMSGLPRPPPAKATEGRRGSPAQHSAAPPNMQQRRRPCQASPGLQAGPPDLFIPKIGPPDPQPTSHLPYLSVDSLSRVEPQRDCDTSVAYGALEVLVISRRTRSSYLCVVIGLVVHIWCV